MSILRAALSSNNTEQELVQEIINLMDPQTYSSLMELSAAESSERGYGSEVYSSDGYNNYSGIIDSSTINTSIGGYGSYSNGYSSENQYNYSQHQDSRIEGHSAGDYGSYSSGAVYSENRYSSDSLRSYTGLVDSNDVGRSAGEYGSYGMVQSPRVPDISNSLPQTPLSPEDMYNTHGYTHQGNYSDGSPKYEAKYLDISNYGPEQNNNSLSSKYDTTEQDMFSQYTYNRDHEIYDQSSGLITCDNDQTWDINDDFESKYYIPDGEMSDLSTGIDQLKLDVPIDNAKPVRGKTRTKKTPKDVNVSSDALNVINQMIPGSGRRARCPKNWEFLMRLLANTETNPSVICWEDRVNYVFRLVEPEKIIEMWNERTHKTSQTYDNFARGLRYHYQKGILQPVPEKQMVYRCGPVAIEYFNNIE